MKYIFFSDIHGNCDALEAVITAVRKMEGVDGIFCLGDIVGYGAQPHECVERVRELGCPVIAGNHDYAASGRMDLNYFNPVARDAVLWTIKALSDDDKQFLWALPLIYEEESFVMVHGTLHDPGSFGYILNDLDAILTFRDLHKDFCFTGHSHFPCVFLSGEKILFTRDSTVMVAKNWKAIVNVGSVGQPRDGDRRACFAVFDSNERVISLRRVEYDVEKAARRILDAGLPEPLADRLLQGM